MEALVSLPLNFPFRFFEPFLLFQNKLHRGFRHFRYGAETPNFVRRVSLASGALCSVPRTLWQPVPRACTGIMNSDPLFHWPPSPGFPHHRKSFSSRWLHESSKWLPSSPSDRACIYYGGTRSKILIRDSRKGATKSPSQHKIMDSIVAVDITLRHLCFSCPTF